MSIPTTAPPLFATLAALMALGCQEHGHHHGDHSHAHGEKDHHHGEKAHAHGDEGHHPPAGGACPHAEKGMPHDFSDVERWSKLFDAPDRDGWQKPAHLVELLAIEPGMTVADIGAGTGYFLPHLSAAVGGEGKVLALDIEQTLVDHMTGRAAKAGLKNVEARVIPPDDPSLPAGAVHRVLVLDTWHHIADREAYTRKIAAGLAAGGRLVIVDFTMESERGPHKEHRLSAEQVSATLSRAGLEPTVVGEQLPDQWVISAGLPPAASK